MGGAEELPDLELEESEMANVLRIRKRLYSGSTVPNLKRMATALGISNRGVSHVLKTRVEVKLRQLRFEDDMTFEPTAADMQLSDAEFDKKFKGKAAYTIDEVADVLRSLVEI